MKINELKIRNQNSDKFDSENIEHFMELFTDLQDLGSTIEIKVSDTFEESYTLKINYKNTLSFNVDKNNLGESIEKNLDDLEKLTNYIKLTHEFMIRLESSGWHISDFWSGHKRLWQPENDTIESWITLRRN